MTWPVRPALAAPEQAGTVKSVPPSAICPGTRVEVVQHHVEAETQPSTMCAHIRLATRLLSRFKLDLERPLRIEIVEQVLHACGAPISASFDANTRVIRISSHNTCARMLSATPKLAQLPVSDWYRSIVMHELVHAALAEPRGAARPPPLAQEYIAYALQLEMLGKTGRETLLAAYPRAIPDDLKIFNSMYLQMSPLAFATNAYRHLFAQSAPEAFVAAILQGKERFPAWDTFE